jgi:hypothetical protein
MDQAASDRNDPVLVTRPGGDAFHRRVLRGVLARKKLCLGAGPITVVRSSRAILEFSSGAGYRRQYPDSQDERGTNSQPRKHPPACGARFKPSSTSSVVSRPSSSKPQHAVVTCAIALDGEIVSLTCLVHSGASNRSGDRPDGLTTRCCSSWGMSLCPRRATESSATPSGRERRDGSSQDGEVWLGWQRKTLPPFFMGIV